MTYGLEGKVVLITGAAGGQGRAGALLFAREGANLALCDIDEDGLRETAELVATDSPTVDIFTSRVDLASMPEIEKFIALADERFGVIDVLYNNAGVNHSDKIENVTEAVWDRHHAINLKSQFFIVKYALPLLRKSTYASVINVSSGAAHIAAADGWSLYCSSRGGSISMTRALARDLAPEKIRVNCILPGPVDTPMVRKFFASMTPEAGEAFREMTENRSLLKRMARPEEIAGVALFLASPAASYMTAAIVDVDGGWLAV